MIRHIYRSLLTLVFALPLNLSAEQIFTAEFAPYEIRKDAEQGTRTLKEYYSEFSPKLVTASDSTATVRHIFNAPPKWSDRVVVLHTENVGTAYEVVINDRLVAAVEDPITPTNTNITQYMTQGVNRIDLILRNSRTPKLQEGVTLPQRAHFSDCYISAQPKTRIHNFSVELTPDPTNQFAILDIEVALRNDSYGDESINVGYDIYDPAGKLLEFSVDEFTVERQTTDTISFKPYIYGVNSNRWSPESPKLYKVMIYVKRNDIITEYIPHKVGFLDVKFSDNKLYNFDKELNLKTEQYNASQTKTQSRKELVAIKAKGRNTISPSYPQPLWFYELCDELGLWVVDQININASKESGNKMVGGTPSNDPKIVGEYIKRGEACYARSRRFGSVIAYSLGGEESGNGYNMYRLYEWMKIKEKTIPILYLGANGEWNSDIIE